MLDRDNVIQKLKKSLEAMHANRICIEDVIELEEDAADALILLKEQEPKKRWIPVTERLPEDDTIVLVVSLLYHKPYPAFQIGGVWYDSFLVACQAAIGMEDEETIDNSGITHWMPLPEPPKEGDDGK